MNTTQPGMNDQNKLSKTKVEKKYKNIRSDAIDNKIVLRLFKNVKKKKKSIVAFSTFGNDNELISQN